jgi:succinylglutamic semialdehyde dehydrogenase
MSTGKVFDIPIRTLQSKGQLIGGEWELGRGLDLHSICPVDDSTIFSGPQADGPQIARAVDAARQAVPEWSALPTTQRIKFVQRFAEAVDGKRDELAELISAETGKPLWESKTEVAAVVSKSPLSIEAFEKRRNTTSFELGDQLAVTRFKPYGVMGILGPFNFPAHLPNGHIVPALLAGNTVVFKPSEQTPAVGQWMIERWSELDLPPGVVNLVQGGREVGQVLAEHRQLDGLLFTGSSIAGRQLHRAFGNTPEKMLALEMGGNNPLVVHDIDNLDAAAYLTIQSAYITAGQRCTCARRLIVVDNNRANPFIDALVAMVAKLRVAYFNQIPEPFVSTVISKSQGARLLDEQAKLIAAGGEPIVAMRSLGDNPALLAPGLIDGTRIATRSDEELFGPILTLIRVPSFAAAIEEANNTAYGLAAGLLSSRQENFDYFIGRIRAGIVNWNRQTTGASGKLPFGGCGLSGNHHPSAFFAADYCSFPVASLECPKLELPSQPSPGIEI